MSGPAFSRCWCPVSRTGVWHRADCSYNGAPAREAEFAAHPTPSFGLTDRETEVAALMVHGDSNLEIASRLTITLGTVEAHVGAILKKTASANRTQAAYRLGST